MEGRPRSASDADERRRQKGLIAREEESLERRAEEEQRALDEGEPSFFADPKRLIQTGVAVVVLIVAIYVLVPKIVGLEGALEKMGDGDPLWIALGIAFNIGAFAAYVALFRGVVGEHVVHLAWRESYQITMAGLAATRLFSAGGAGGILLTYWALRKAGMERRQSVCRMVAFLVLLYSVYMVALVVFGILLRTGVLSGDAPLSGTVIPAVLAGAVIGIALLIALVPEDVEHRIEGHISGRFGRIAQRLATAPATLAQGTRTAIAFARHPRSGALAVGGAIGFWAANIAILWASFHAFDVAVPLGVVVQGFFLGMIANLFPLAPGGVGAVDAGMIGAFVLFGIPGAEVFAAVLTYRVIAFWLPIPPGIIAFFQLRNTVQRWEREGRRPGRVGVGEPEAARA
ncbi:MAG: lysylphosphatidylglycerol synthase transmembrane domain-containing protein [Solirubrobacterales bacterium]